MRYEVVWTCIETELGWCLTLALVAIPVAAPLLRRWIGC